MPMQSRALRFRLPARPASAAILVAVLAGCWPASAWAETVQRLDSQTTQPPPLCTLGDTTVPAQVQLSSGQTVTTEAHGDIVADQMGQIKRVSLLLTSVSTASGTAGLISVFWDTNTSSPGSFSSFTADVHYQLIDDQMGLVKDSIDTYSGSSEQFDGQFSASLIDPTTLRGQISLTLRNAITGLLVRIIIPDFRLACGAAPAPCPADKQCKKRVLCVQPVVIAETDGTMPTTCPDFGKAKTIWGKCCTDLNVKAVKTIKDPSFKKLDADCGAGRTKKEKDLVKLQTDDGNAAPDNDCVEVYCITRFVESGTEKEDCNGGAYTIGGGKENAKIVAQSDTDPTVLAHELGHVVGLDHPATDDGTVMHPSGKNKTPVSEKQSKTNCKNGVKGLSKVKKPETDCCQTWELDQ